MKPVWQATKTVKKLSWLTSLLVLGEVGLEILIPFWMSDLIDYGINGQASSIVWQIGAVLVGFSGLALLFGLASGRCAALASAGFGENLRQALFQKIQALSLSDWPKFTSATLVTRLTTDVTNLQNTYQTLIRVAVRSPLLLLLSWVMSFILSPQLALLYLGLIPLVGFGLYLLMSRAAPILRKVYSLYDQLNQIVQENLRGIRVIKSLTREETEKKRLAAISQQIYQNFSKSEKLLTLNSPLMQLSIYTLTLGAAWWGSGLILQGELSTGELVSFIFYSGQILTALMMSSMIFMTAAMAKASYERVEEVLTVPTVSPSNKENDLRVSDGSVVLQEVSFSYSQDLTKLCLQNINLTVKSGQTVGIVGRLGSGKSSLAGLLLGLYQSTSGRIWLGGHQLQDYSLPTLRQAVGLVEQNNWFFKGSIRANLLWGNSQASEADLDQACQITQIADFIQSLPQGFDSLLEQEAVNLSGGQRQRLAIARALLRKPQILILDEADNALDLQTQAQLWQALHQSLPEVTKIIITQRSQSWQKADLIIHLEGGLAI